MKRHLAMLTFAVGLIVGAAGGATQLLAATPQIDPLPPAKQAFEDRLDALRNSVAAADGSISAKSKDAAAPLILQVEEPPVLGLLEGLDAPISGTIFSPTNAWAGWVSGNYVRIWAGAPADDQAHALLFIVSRPADGTNIDWSTASDATLLAVPIPGPVSIRAVESGVMILANPAGAVIRFVPDSRAFL
jgi:hypothetical protein